MDIKHFLKMLLGLIVMAIIGFGGLFIVNNFAKKQPPKSGSAIPAPTGQGNFKPISPINR